MCVCDGVCTSVRASLVSCPCMCACDTKCVSIDGGKSQGNLTKSPIIHRIQNGRNEAKLCENLNLYTLSLGSSRYLSLFPVNKNGFLD